VALVDAIRKAGAIAPQSAPLAYEVAAGLRRLGFPNVKPLPEGPGEKEFQGGLGPKKVDVSYADERHGLLLAVSIKSICFPPYGKNLKNRFGDLCTEAITLHMRFPYSVVCTMLAMPEETDQDRTRLRRVSSLQRAGMLLGTITGRADYTAPGERFEDVTMMLFGPERGDGTDAWVTLYHASPRLPLSEITEAAYFAHLRDIYNERNPHAQVGIEELKAEGEDGPTDSEEPSGP
jgi:hypothetical protein